MTVKEDMKEEVEAMQLYRAFLSIILGVKVTELEAATMWAEHGYAELYRENHKWGGK